MTICKLFHTTYEIEGLMKFVHTVYDTYAQGRNCVRLVYCKHHSVNEISEQLTTIHQEYSRPASCGAVYFQIYGYVK